MCKVTADKSRERRLKDGGKKQEDISEKRNNEEDILEKRKKEEGILEKRKEEMQRKQMAFEKKKEKLEQQKEKMEQLRMKTVSKKERRNKIAKHFTNESEVKSFVFEKTKDQLEIEAEMERIIQENKIIDDYTNEVSQMNQLNQSAHFEVHSEMESAQESPKLADDAMEEIEPNKHWKTAFEHNQFENKQFQKEQTTKNIYSNESKIEDEPDTIEDGVMEEDVSVQILKRTDEGQTNTDEPMVKHLLTSNVITGAEQLNTESRKIDIEEALVSMNTKERMNQFNEDSKEETGEDFELSDSESENEGGKTVNTQAQEVTNKETENTETLDAQSESSEGESAEKNGEHEAVNEKAQEHLSDDDDDDDITEVDKPDVVTVMSDTEEAVHNLGDTSNTSFPSMYLPTFDTTQDHSTAMEDVDEERETNKKIEDDKAAENLMKSMDGTVEDEAEEIVQVEETFHRFTALNESEKHEREKKTIEHISRYLEVGTSISKRKPSKDDLAEAMAELNDEPRQVQNTKVASSVRASSKKRRCMTCDPCRKPNCGLCRFCRDLKTNGGTGRLRQPCLERRCESMVRGRGGGQVQGQQIEQNVEIEPEQQVEKEKEPLVREQDLIRPQFQNQEQKVGTDQKLEEQQRQILEERWRRKKEKRMDQERRREERRLQQDVSRRNPELNVFPVQPSSSSLPAPSSMPTPS